MRPRHCELFPGRVGCELKLVKRPSLIAIVVLFCCHMKIDTIKSMRSNSVVAIQLQQFTISILYLVSTLRVDSCAHSCMA
jgi:hypothetical protein